MTFVTVPWRHDRCPWVRASSARVQQTRRYFIKIRFAASGFFQFDGVHERCRRAATNKIAMNQRDRKSSRMTVACRRRFSSPQAVIARVCLSETREKFLWHEGCIDAWVVSICRINNLFWAMRSYCTSCTRFEISRTLVPKKIHVRDFCTDAPGKGETIIGPQCIRVMPYA
jgi:hypothetical protein